MTRRELLQNGFATIGLLPRGELAGRSTLDPATLAQFVDPLTIPAVARSNGVRPSPVDSASKVLYYRLAMRQIEAKVHRDLPATRLWGFAGSAPGPTIEARSGEAVMVEWVNELPRQHFLPIDHTVHGAGTGVPPVRTVVHLHGGRVPPESDGYPENWFIPGKSVVNFYPNRQDATMLWYHDHTIGINRLNILAGLFGTYFIRDGAEDSLNLPRGRYEVPLLIYDRMLRTDGQLYYPVSSDPKSPWIPEFFGDAILINGKLFPYLDVEARRYRFRLLNASNGRFYYLSLSNGQTMYQIGSDQGLLPAPVPLRALTLAPGERTDIVIDFNEQRAKRIVLKSDALTLMQFRVSPLSSNDKSLLPDALRPIRRIPESAALRQRPLTLDETDNAILYPLAMLLNGKHWHEPVTERPVLDSVEIWSLINLTDDSHPIHLHLVRFQILDRRPFDLFTYLNTKKLVYTGPPVAPDANEAGWKDTVRADPRVVTRIIIRFEGYAGRYVWHCHVLEHEDNDMMRPYDVIRPTSPLRDSPMSAMLSDGESS
jgi:spore coat protein A, manganese oxidase